jgi:hypothetical protein
MYLLKALFSENFTTVIASPADSTFYIAKSIDIESEPDFRFIPR